MLFLQSCLTSLGRVNVSVDGTPATYNAGIAYDADGLPCVTEDAVEATDAYSGGFARSATGLLRIYDATAGLPDPVYSNAGIATTEDGAVCITTDAVDVDDVYYLSGMAVTADGRVYMDTGA
jgi:hypothetical protein